MIRQQLRRIDIVGLQEKMKKEFGLLIKHQNLLLNLLLLLDQEMMMKVDLLKVSWQREKLIRPQLKRIDIVGFQHQPLTVDGLYHQLKI